jgi:sugar phosphate isomerase/epimerase
VAIKNSLQQLKEKKLHIVDLGSSAAMHHAKKDERTKNLDDAKRYIDLAQKLNCPFVRVFPNDLPKDDTRSAVMELIINGLQQLGDYAKGSDVTVLMESHGDVVRTADLKKIMESANNKHVGLVWDITNMWTITKESPADVYAQLKPHIRHTHIKDAKLTGDKIDYVLLGKGDTPIFDAIDILRKDGYKGYYSFEWEKRWHPEIAEPEIALADYPRAMKEHFALT